MNTGYISIKENENGEFTILVKPVDGTVWLTKHEISHLFNVHVNSINSNIRSIFNTRLLLEESVSKQYSYVENGKNYITALYNFDVILFLAYRINSREVIAFRKWILTSLNKYLKNQSNKVVISCFNPALLSIDNRLN